MGQRKVFISHSATDTDWARSFAQALEQRGVTVRSDEIGVHPGESWSDALETGLRGSDVVVALLDSESSSRPNLFFELGAAIAMGKRVVAIVPNGIDLGVLPLRRYLIRDTPEQNAEEFSNTLLAA